MIPVLFDETAAAFNTNGITRLPDAVDCTVTEERNGSYELVMEYPNDGKGYSEIEYSRIIGVVPHDGGTMQGFRIYRIDDSLGDVTKVYARHISYQLSNIPVAPFSVSASPSACSQVLQLMKSRAMETCPFTFWTDVAVGASYNQDVPAPIRSRLGGVEGSVLDQFGGEYEWDNWTVKLHTRRGRTNTGVTLRYGKNITDLNQEKNISNVVTGVVPYWKPSGDEGEVVYAPAVHSRYAAAYPYSRTITYDFSQVYENQPTQAQLTAAATSYVNQTDIGLPAVSIDVSFVALWQTEEYKDIAPLERVQLCDEVTVQFEKLGINTTAKVVATEYDVLRERYKSISLGTIRTSLAKTIAGQAAQIESVKEFADKEIRSAVVSATAWLTSADGVVMARKDENGTWKELFFMDSYDCTATAGNVLRINVNGLGFSKTGWDGPFEQAWTLDGQLIIGGTNNASFYAYDASGKTIASFTKAKSTIAGWIIDAWSIYKDTNESALGGNAANVGMSVRSSLPAFWAGQPYSNAGNAPFRVTHAGETFATNAHVTGEITSSSGSIGGWTLANGQIWYNHGNKSAGIGCEGTSYAFWAGNPGGYQHGENAAFRVTHEGELTATNVHITGDGTFSGTLQAAGGTFNGTLSANCITSGTLSATRISGGTLDTSTINVTNLRAEDISTGILDASKITVTNLDASEIKTGNLSANYISGGTLDASSMTVTNLSANSITGGSINADNVSITNLHADNIKAGTVLDASQVTVTNLNADNITSGHISASKINAASGDSLNIGAANISAYDISSHNLTASGDLYTNGWLYIKRNDSYVHGITGDYDIGGTTYKFVQGVLVERA